MQSPSTFASWALFFGDIFALSIALWATLLVRYGSYPEINIYVNHIVPFSLLFLFSTLVFFIAGLYDKHTLLVKRGTGETILYAQLVNVFVAAVFFFLVPFFGIQPKTNLVIYLLLSSTLVIIWRVYIVPIVRSRYRHEALLVGSGSIFDELYREINTHDRYPIVFTEHIRVARAHRDAVRNQVFALIEQRKVALIVIDIGGRSVEELFPEWYVLMQKGIRFIDASDLYEQTFDRVPLSLLEYKWFIHYAFTTQAVAYGIAKRIVDICIATTVGIITLPLYPIIALFIRREDGGPIFYTHPRVGKNNTIIYVYKFRSMSTKVKEKVTKVGEVIRKYRLDELPQLWNVLRGDLSMIGPRPEAPHLVEGYSQEITYYATRHIVQPGLSGWAQINEYDVPKGGVLDVERTKKKLAYDLYYIKNRSLILDLTIALKTIRAILSRNGT